MDTSIITEISRINIIMGNGPIIIEAVTPGPGLLNALKNIFVNSSDDVVEKFIIKTGTKAFDDKIDDIIRKLKNGESVAKQNLNLLLSQLDGNELSKILVKSQKILGDNFYNKIEDYKKILKSNPEKYQEVMDSINTIIDNYPPINNLPNNIKQGLRKEFKDDMYSVISTTSKKFKPFSSLQRGNFDKIIKGYKSGYNSSPDVLSKIFKNVTSLHWPTSNFSSKEYKQLLMWLTTGSSRMPDEIVKLFRQHGFGAGIASFGGEFVKKYFKILRIVVGLKMAYQIILDLTDGKENFPSDATMIEIIWDRIRKAWEWPDAKWVIPAMVTLPILQDILGPILRGNDPWEKILEKLKNETSKYSEDLDKMVEDTKKNVDDKKNQIMDKIQGSEIGFQVFAKKNNLTIKREYDGVSGETNEADPKNSSNFNWYFDNDKGTFMSY